MSMHLQNRRLSAALAASLLFAVGGIAAPVVASPAYVFNVRIGSTCAYGTGPVSQAMKVILASSSGHVLGTVSTTSASNGFWSACFSRTVRPGMKLTARHGSVLRSLTIPTLTVATDRVANTLAGSAPAGQSLQVGVQRCSMQGSCPTQSYAASVDGSGHYHLDLNTAAPSYDLRGNDGVTVIFTTTKTDTIEADATVPYMIAEHPSLVVIQGMKPGTNVTVTLKAADNSVRVRLTQTITNPYSNAFMLRKGGVDKTIHTGNSIWSTIASDAHFSWDVTLSGNAGTDVVSGHCFANGDLRVGVGRASVGSEAHFTTAQPDGTFTSDFTSFGVSSGDTLDLQCRSVTGDEVTYTTVVP
jgi:hypothetical protein